MGISVSAAVTLPGNRHIAKPVDDPFVTAEDIGVRL